MRLTICFFENLIMLVLGTNYHLLNENWGKNEEY